MDGYIWGDAEVTYPDWVGTAQLDERKTIKFNETIGLDENWFIVGLDLGGGEHGHDLRVLAIHHDDVPSGGDVLPRIAEANGGEIPATEFLIHDVDPYDVLKKVTHMFELRLRLSRSQGIPIRVRQRGDVPEQPS